MNNNLTKCILNNLFLNKITYFPPVNIPVPDIPPN